MGRVPLPMEQEPKGFDEQSWVRLSDAVEEAFGRMEFIIEDYDKSRLLYIEATRERCKIEFTWNRFTAGIAVIVALIAGITKYWS
jgi:hypothetical protein